jgi:hypothetical protein
VICAQCGADLPEGALFCGECGSPVYATPSQASSVHAVAHPPQVSAPPAAPVTPLPSQPSQPSVPVESDAASQPDADATGAESNSTRVVDLLEQADHWRPTPRDFPSGDSESESMPPSSAEQAGGRQAEAALQLDEATRMPERAAAPAVHFTLHFSTGESVRVEGTGLIGRRPVAQPGEFFDTYVTVDDPGRSVSKTHLEFGHDGGVFWISDRFSANGTVVREPERAPRLCPAGMRSRVARGSRVDIGEQFFVVT